MVIKFEAGKNSLGWKIARGFGDLVVARRKNCPTRRQLRLDSPWLINVTGTIGGRAVRSDDRRNFDVKEKKQLTRREFLHFAGTTEILTNKNVLLHKLRINESGKEG